MPSLSMFLGLIIRMRYAPKEHNSPHFHVEYQGEEAAVKIEDGSVIAGKLSSRNLKLVQAWVELHKDELIADWDLCRKGEQPYKIDPLK